uniref:Pre-mRNA-splicing factor 38 n=1 Tax=Globodera pallida TaxID=36090 RepID=A0A183CAX1_GLOPA
MSSQSVIYEKTVKNSGRQDTDWCLTSERRLFQKLIHHKPVGINRHFNIDMLVMYMNNIFDYEDDINFEIEEKLNEYYDMELIQENESPSEELEKNAVFELPTEYQYKEEMAPR